MKKVLALMMAVMLLCCGLAGCGSAGDNSSDVSDAPAKPKVIVGYTIYEPMNYLDESGKLVGFDTELAQAVFGNLGYDVIFKEIKWESKYTELNTGAIDCIWNGFTCNSADDDGVARADKVDFSYRYMENQQVIVVKEGSSIKTAADLKGKIADAEIGSAGESYAKGLDESIIFKGATKQTDCLLSVKSGNADFAVLDMQLAKSYCGKGDYANLKVIDELSSDLEYYAIGFKKGSELTAKVNAELEKLAADGALKTIAEKYKLGNSVITEFDEK